MFHHKSKPLKNKLGRIWQTAPKLRRAAMPAKPLLCDSSVLHPERPYAFSAVSASVVALYFASRSPRRMLLRILGFFHVERISSVMWIGSNTSWDALALMRRGTMTGWINKPSFRSALRGGQGRRMRRRRRGRRRKSRMSRMKKKKGKPG